MALSNVHTASLFLDKLFIISVIDYSPAASRSQSALTLN